MKRYLRTLVLASFVSLALASCSDSKSNPEEEAEIRQMDSTSRAVEDSTERLKEQTRKVEENLEKLDKEFESNQQNK